MTTPLLGLSEIAEGVDNQAALHNTALRQMETRSFRVLSMTTTTPAVGAAESDSYIIPAGATGVWSGKTNQIAGWVGGAWSYYTPLEGIGGIWVNDLDTAYSFDGSAWVASGGVGASAPFTDTTAIVKGSADATKKIRFEADGLTTGTTRVLTIQDADGTVALTSQLSSYQPVDSDLTTIAGLTATTDNFIQSKSGAWASRTVAQVSTDLQGTGLITDAVGFRTIPQNSQSAAYTTVAADAGKHILHPAADTTARTWTIDSNANVAYPIGTAITFINENAGGVITIAITSDTMRLAGAGTTGNRSLAANGVATAIKITSTSWIISGTGLT
jgi:hypothetical protein